MKRVIGLRLIDVSHSERVQSVVTEFGLKDKVFSVTLDASSNTSAMASLIPKFLG